MILRGCRLKLRSHFVRGHPNTLSLCRNLRIQMIICGFVLDEKKEIYVGNACGPPHPVFAQGHPNTLFLRGDIPTHCFCIGSCVILIIIFAFSWDEKE